MHVCMRGDIMSKGYLHGIAVTLLSQRVLSIIHGMASRHFLDLIADNKFHYEMG